MGAETKILTSDFFILFGGSMLKNKLRTKRKSIEPSISSEKENEKIEK